MTASDKTKDGGSSAVADTQPGTAVTVAELLAENAALTKALTGLTCGGSEFFIRKGDRYVADIPACVGYVQRAREALAARWLDAVRAAKATPPATPIAGGFGPRPQDAVVPTEPVADRWADLERLAKAAYRDYGVADIAVGGGMRATVSVPAFIAAANPAAILELIAAARRDEEAGQ
jgi:hypothetical protein